MEKLEYLNKYTLDVNKKVELLTNIEVGDMKEGLIPNEWKIIFQKDNKQEKIISVLQMWSKYVGKELSNTIAYLKDNLIDVEIMKIGNKYSLLYSINGENNKVLFYEGRNPKERIMREDLKKDWPNIPNKIREFYENVHSGFYYYASKSMGLDAYENITYLNDYEWGILEEIELAEVKIDLKSSYGFFSNGMGDYVVIDYNNCEESNATLWSSKEEPEYSLNFWDVVDEWIVIGFE